MRRQTIRDGASALLLLATVAQGHKGAHDRLEAIHRRHHEQRVGRRAVNESHEYELVKRGQCAFPTDAGLVAVTPGSANAGWAMSPDQSCQPGNYCPYACPSGQVSMQWDPKATTYSYPQSMNGGLYCDSNGQISKPFPDKPYCQSTATNIGVVNNAGGNVAFCQTVLPGNEAMLIPTSVNGYATLAVPGMDYWANTAAHYYINPPGTDAGTACVWGTNSNPWGNWSPYVAGANQDASGEIFIKLGWNPIYLEAATPFRNTMPSWGVEIDCPNGGCNGLPCSISPSTNSVNQMSGSATNGAGGASYCVVTVAKGSVANFVITGGTGSNSNSGKGGQFYQSWSGSSSSSTSSIAPTTTQSTTSKVATTTPSTTTTSVGSSSNSTTTSQPTTTWTMQNSTQSYSSRPSGGQPYYSLFSEGGSSSQTISFAASETTDQPSMSTSTSPVIASHTGAGSKATTSFGLVALSTLLFWCLLL